MPYEHDIRDIRDSVVELREVNKRLVEINNSMDANLKALNDHFILHGAETKADHMITAKALERLCDENGRLIRYLLYAVLVLAGTGGTVGIVIFGG